MDEALEKNKSVLRESNVFVFWGFDVTKVGSDDEKNHFPGIFPGSTEVGTLTSTAGEWIRS